MYIDMKLYFLCSLLLNIFFMNDLLSFAKDIGVVNFADENTIFGENKDTQELIKSPLKRK